MSTSIIHSLTPSGPRCQRVTAPGWIPAAEVLRALEIESPDRAEPVRTDSTWSAWARAHPVVVRGGTVPFLPLTMPTPSGHARVVVRSGPESGFALALPLGEWTLGRGAGADAELADPYLSRRPHRLVNGPSGIRIDGEAPRNGERTLLGSTELRLPGRSVAAPGGFDARSLPDSLHGEGPLEWPEPQEVSPVRKPSWLLYAAPIVIGVVLALLVGTWWFLLLSLAGPLTAILTLRADRRRFARETVLSSRAHRREIERTLRQLDYDLRDFAATLDRIAYGGANAPGQVPERARFVCVGIGSVVSSVAVQLPKDRKSRARARSCLPPHRCEGDQAFLIARDAPLLVDRSMSVRITGPEASVQSVVRSLLVAHAASGCGIRANPKLPEFAGITGQHPVRVEEVADDGDAGTARVSAAAAGAGRAHLTAVVHGRGAGSGAESSDRTLGTQVPDVVTIACGSTSQTGAFEVPGAADTGGVRLSSGPTSDARAARPRVIGRLLSGPVAPHAITRASALRLLAGLVSPPTTARPIGTAQSSGMLGAPGSTHAFGPAHAPGIAAAHTPLVPAEQIAPTGITDLLRLWESAGRPGDDVLVVPLGTPAARPTAPAQSVRAGAGPTLALTGSAGTPLVLQAAIPSGLPHDLFLLDLRASGPHALVAGTTGSGKSVLLETWLEALCRTHSPEHLRLVLLDFKGGASLSRFTSRPHTDTVLTDLDEAAALRALRSITAEISRRELHLARSGCRDIDELHARSRADPTVTALPRLAIVIDEFHVLAALSPHVVARFERLTAVGRSLGVHLILATQRPSGVVSARMRANIALRICLRVRDESDSQEVLGIPDAAWIDVRVPGTALVSDEAGVRALRCALPDELISSPDASPAESAAFETHTTSAPNTTSAPVVRIRSLLDDAEAEVPLACVPPPAVPVQVGPEGPRHEIIAAPLPAALSATDAAAAVEQEAGAADEAPAEATGSAGGTTRPREGLIPPAHGIVGLADLPEQNRTAHVRLTSASGSIAVTGGRGRGWTTAIASIARAWASVGLPVVRVSVRGTFRFSANDLPSVDADGVLHVAHDHRWFLDHLLDTCAEAREPVVWAIDDWDELAHAHPTGPRIERLERLLTGSAGVRFAVSGPRRGLGQRLVHAATTRIVFPPAAEADTVLHGVSADRFRGDWPPGRAVILGDEARTDERDGADIQIVQCAQTAGDCESRMPTHPLWTGFVHRSDHRAAQGTATRGAILIGIDPSGRPVFWNPGREGSTVTVRCPPAPGSTTAVQALADWLRDQGVVVIDQRADCVPDPHDSAASRPICLLAGSPGLRSAGLAGDAPAGPELFMGAWRESDLRAAGHRWLAPLPDAAQANWWLSGAVTTPVRIVGLARAPLESFS